MTPPDTDAPADVSAAGPAPLVEPSLRTYWKSHWTRLPRRVRQGGLLVAAGLAVLWVAGVVRSALPAEPVDAEAVAEAARAEWAAILRRAPETLQGTVFGTLGPGDAERPDGRYEDYYVVERADSAAFALVLTSPDFEPDLSVRVPWGGVRAASTLLETSGRAEVTALRGPGRFEITVTARSRDATGAYELAVVPEVAPDSLFADDPPRGDSLGRGVRRVGRYERTFALHTGSEVPVVVSVVSDAFRPRVELIGPSGEVGTTYRTLERDARGDSLHGVVLRYLPGWDAPYRLRVSSAEPGATGRFAVEVRRVPVRDLRLDDRGVSATLGDASWLEAGRYVDTYRLRIPDGAAETVIEATSRDIPPGLRLTRVGGPPQRPDARPAAEAPNAAGALSARIAQTLPAGDYHLEVTTGGAVADSTRPAGGAYAVVARIVRPEPPPSSAPAGPPPGSRQFGASSERTGTSGGNTFAVGVTNVAISYPGGRTRVQLSVSVRSVDYTGAWAPWMSFASKAFVVDDAGRRYSPASGESVSPSGPAASPGTVRRGTVVFYAPERVTGQRRFVLVASVGESTVSVPVTVP